MSGNSMPPKLLLLTVFPFLQMVLFGLSCLLVTSHLAWAAACIMASGVALNFTIHICVHEFLHYSDRHPLPGWLNLVISSVSGQTFDGYRFHHHNHHRHNNGADDFSRTWRMTPDGPVPYSVWRYVLGWPAQTVRTSRALKHMSPLPPPIQKLRRRMRHETYAIGGLLLVMGLCSWKFVVLYAAMVYLGWALVTMHNYGQHPPDTPEDIQSFASRWYNRLFFNNGLHYEHHAEPSKPWHELRANSRAPQIHESHLVSPLWRKLRSVRNTCSFFNFFRMFGADRQLRGPYQTDRGCSVTHGRQKNGLS